MNFAKLLSRKKTEKNSSFNQIKETKVENLFALGSKNNKDTAYNLSSDLNINLYGSKAEDSFLIGLVNDMFIDAIKSKASDIHIEPNDKNLSIRFRVDGSFIVYKPNLNIEYKDSIIARIKIMSYLRIDEHRLPQDGKIAYKLFGGKQLDMRVSIIPTIYGEKCVIRILKKDEIPPKMEDLGMMTPNIEKVKKHINDNYGMILAVGPTGSGKSTTLFSLLSQYNPEEKNISTLEDPVEYRIKGVNHTQINTAINFTFARGLRSLLRQDPDIIMVGEIRDEETARLAVEASITGHIVFSTIHTNSATHTIQRLINLGVDPLLITSSLRMIISQRLARRLCPKCKIQYEANEKVKNFILEKIGKYMLKKDKIILYKVSEGGCEHCNHTGYDGRIGLFEILEISEKLENLILSRASRLQLEMQAIADGMIPIRDDGLMRAITGEISLEEVLSVLGT